jgi:hypothetical protein
MGGLRRGMAAGATIGIAVAGAVLVASFLPGQPHPSVRAGWVIFGLACFAWLVGSLGFLAPWFGGPVPFDVQARHDSQILGWGILWDRASSVERVGVHVATLLAFLLWIPAATAEPGSVLKQQLLATLCALAFIAALGLIVVGSRPIEVDVFDEPRIL